MLYVFDRSGKRRNAREIPSTTMPDDLRDVIDVVTRLYHEVPAAFRALDIALASSRALLVRSAKPLSATVIHQPEEVRASVADLLRLYDVSDTAFRIVADVIRDTLAQTIKRLNG